MYNFKKILAIIPARGGSKGLPGKNIRPLCGKPLIGWTIEHALASEYIDEIFVSTDSRKIADIAEKFGINVPFLRPDELATDTSSSMEVVENVLEYYQSKKIEFDYILLLEPTSPLRKEGDLDAAINLAVTNEIADGVISLGKVHMEHPLIVKKVNKEGKISPYIDDSKKITQRQQADNAYFPYGVAYIIKTEVFRREKMFYTDNILPYYIERWQNYEIDDIYDFISVEAIFSKIREEQV